MTVRPAYLVTVLVSVIALAAGGGFVDILCALLVAAVFVADSVEGYWGVLARAVREEVDKR